METLLLLLVLVALFVGYSALRRRMDLLSRQLRSLERNLDQVMTLVRTTSSTAAIPAVSEKLVRAPAALEVPAKAAPVEPAPVAAVPEKPVPPPAESAKAEPTPLQTTKPEPPPFAPKPEPIAPPAAASAPARTFDLEVLLGTRVLARVGMFMVIVASAYFLRYAYDQQWIGPKGRTLIGVLVGLAALASGEYFRRQKADVLFQTLTGGAIGIFYVCVYFAFHVYQIAGAGATFGCASLITLLAIALAVLHNSMPIAILGQLGGFLSPVLLSTGENHPYALFCYVAALDMTAFVAAFFRRWRMLDLLSFMGTLLLYQGWYAKYHAPDQLVPALLFTTLFYVMFLVIPSVYGLVRRNDEGYQGLTLIAADAMHSLLSYHEALFDEHRQVMGCVVLAQALMMYLLFRAWRQRVGAYSNTVHTLLVLCVALVTLVVPILLDLYAVPLAWATEAVVLNWMANRYGRLIVRIGGSVALLLALLGLLNQLPLHADAFVPVFNPVFASWLWVAVAAAAVSWLLKRHEATVTKDSRVPLEVCQAWTCCAFVVAYALAYALFTMEIHSYWSFTPDRFSELHRLDSLLVVWSAVLLVTGGYLFRRGHFAWLPHLIWITLPPAGAFLLGLDRMFRYDGSWLFVNTPFLAHAFAVVVLWVLAGLARQAANRIEPGTSASAVFTLTSRELHLLAATTEMVAHALLAVLLATEFSRWGRHSDLVSGRLALGMISAAWAAQAFFLIWHGLWSRQRPRRIAGLTLFGLALAKVLLFDTVALERVYRIVAWGGSGLLLVAAAIFYHRYLSVFTDSQAPVPQSEAAPDEAKDS